MAFSIQYNVGNTFEALPIRQENIVVDQSFTPPNPILLLCRNITQAEEAVEYTIEYRA